MPTLTTKAVSTRRFIVYRVSKTNFSKATPVAPSSLPKKESLLIQTERSKILRRRYITEPEEIAAKADFAIGIIDLIVAPSPIFLFRKIKRVMAWKKDPKEKAAASPQAGRPNPRIRIKSEAIVKTIPIREMVTGVLVSCRA